MNVKTIHMSDLFSQCDDLYLASMIVAKRAKQIIDDRVIPIVDVTAKLLSEALKS